MPTLPNPWLILGALAVFVAVWFYRGETVRAERNAYWKGQIEAANKAAEKAKGDADALVEATKAQAKDDLDRINERLKATLGDLDVQNRRNDLLAARIAAGDGVRIPVANKSCPASPVRPAEPATGNSDTQYAELPPETVQRLADSADAANAAARRHNACLDAYAVVQGRLKELNDATDRISNVSRGSPAATP